MRVIALAGNPNVGKSTLFNALTGMNQHTGNWPGKTVELAQGQCTYKGESYRLVDLPGTYSLVSHSPEETVTEEFLQSGEAECVVAVCDATCLERSLILALQIIELCQKLVICINLMDEAQRQHLQIDAGVLSEQLGVPVVLTSAEEQEDVLRLMETLREVCDGFMPMQRRRIGCGIRGETQEESDEIARCFVHRAQELAQLSVRCTEQKATLTQRLDAVFLHRRFGYVSMLMLLLLVFWLTIEGANYPSQALQWCFDRLGAILLRGAQALKLPTYVTGALLDGVYATVGRVVSVMLPPMAIFFPLFTILEDLGYLPRIAFLLDERFRRAGACGKQSLTMCMGFGCNAVGVTGCRIIDSPHERRIAILTNALVPCNGRFPALIFLIGLSFSFGSSLLSALILMLCVLLSVLVTLLASKLLHKTCTRHAPSAFVLELPPYRKPHIGQVIVRSVLDRTLFVLGRAVAVAAPAGLLIWLFANVSVGGQPLLQLAAEFLDTPAKWMGLNGAILLAFLLGSPANELVIPILLMILTAGTRYCEGAMEQTLLASGWTWQLSLCSIVFFLFHWPCTTTLWTVYKETRSLRQMLLAAALPTVFGVGLCMLLNLVLQL